MRIIDQHTIIINDASEAIGKKEHILSLYNDYLKLNPIYVHKVYLLQEIIKRKALGKEQTCNMP